MVLGLGCFVSTVPDLDVIGFRFGIHYGDVLGHRGFTHSLFFAVILAGVASLAFIDQKQISSRRLFLYLFLAAVSHGVLDAMIRMVGWALHFFSPFTNARFFFPFRPVEVSPIGVGRFFSSQGLVIIQSEAKWLWLPSAIIFFIATFIRRLRRSNAA